ncbi:hypothetical protein [Pedobacter sp. CFBP9032]|uniref:hypothetical protein n=1 Tax=Pedobacter sp. CFBP9032 TaxID=3096539 RepID=UPI002A6A8F23|nr:hypothetical protein [Pedobacter sp. CFBP9032]MDY0906701.1 hypothetical protein [Pedobacter sp. CFBP9032]
MKNTFSFLKQYGLALFLLFIISILIYSCKKDRDTPAVSSLTLNELQSWYTLNSKMNSESHFKTMKPKWESVFVNEQADQTIYELNLENPDQIFQVINSSNDVKEESINKNIIKLLLFKNKNSPTINYGVYVSILNEGNQINLTELHYKDMDKLTGKVMYFNFDGSFSNGWNYIAGKTITSIIPISETAYINAKIDKLSARQPNKFTDKERLQREISGDCNGTITDYGVACAGVEGYMECKIYEKGTSFFSGCGGGNGTVGGGGYTGSGSTGGQQGGGSGSSGNNINNFILDKATQNKFPKFSELIKKLESFVANDQKVLNALIQWSGYNKEQIIEKVKFGNGPTIVVKELTGKYGYFDRNENPNVINIDESWVKGLESANLLETKQATGFFLAVTVLHEFVHQARAANGLDRSYEYGYGFENSAFGLKIEDDGITPFNYRFRLYKK